MTNRLPSVAQKCFCWSSRLCKAEKVIFELIKHFIHVGSNVNLSLRNNMRRINEQTIFLRSNTGSHWNAMLREAAAKRSVPIWRCKIQKQSKYNWHIWTYFGDCSPNFCTQDEEEVTSSFLSEVRKNTMYGSILPVTNRPPCKGKTAESWECVWGGGNR